MVICVLAHRPHILLRAKASPALPIHNQSGIKRNETLIPISIVALRHGFAHFRSGEYSGWRHGHNPDGRTGKIESFKDRVAKVKLGAGENDFQYLEV